MRIRIFSDSQWWGWRRLGRIMKAWWERTIERWRRSLAKLWPWGGDGDADPQPQPGPNPEPPPSDQHIVRQIRTWWGGHRGMESARVDNNFRLTVSGDGRTWSAAPSDWPVGRAGPGCPGDCNVMVCAAYQRSDGTWAGGKYEWNRARPSTRSWANIKNGYNGWQAPPNGTRMVCWCYTADGHRVSTQAEATFQ